MRFVVVGAGAVGGVVGGRLFEHGHDVVVVARGEHGRVIATQGLRLDSPGSTVTLPVPAVERVDRVEFSEDDVVLLAVKSQDTAAALDLLATAAPPSTPVVCLQNGVDNERAALRRFEHVYGVAVMCPTGHLRPGIVQAYSSPVAGILDIGCHPSGVDDLATEVASAFARSTFVSVARPDIARWKWRKLLTNLGNVVLALCAASPVRRDLIERAREEGEACLRAAGIDFASEEEDAERRGDLLRVQPIGDEPRPGNSSWQSLARRTGAIETDYLNGEIVLLGRLHGVAVPVNALLQRAAREHASAGRDPATVAADDLLAACAYTGAG